MADIPRHIGFIIDGNRRWAKARGLDAWQGHESGYETIKTVLLETLRQGVFYTSAYIFSTENWKRSPREVKKLMDLLLRVLEDDAHIFMEENVRLRVIGSRQRLSKRLVAAIEKAEATTKALSGGQLLLCLNYGGQQEIADAVKRMIHDGVKEDNVTPDTIEHYLYASGVPPCDLIVRTSGEQRLSNFMLWRSAYSELMFINKAWPDMTTEDVTSILSEYKQRKRRFGG